MPGGSAPPAFVLKRAAALALLGALGAPTLPGAADQLFGSELRVNTSTMYPQGLPQIAADASGRFLVVWIDQPASLDGELQWRAFSSAGVPAGFEFGGFQYFPQTVAVAANPAGSFVVATSLLWDQAYDVLRLRVSETGLSLSEARVNTHTTGNQTEPRVAFSGNGSVFIVVWRSTGDGDDGIFGQRYAANGTPAGENFRVSTSSGSAARYPDVAVDGFGNFVVVWQAPDGYGAGVWGQRYTAAGAPAGSQFHADPYLNYEQMRPRVAWNTGGFVVIWDSDGTTFGALGGRRFTPFGEPMELGFQLSSNYSPWRPSVATRDDGTVFTWTQRTPHDGSGTSVTAQRYDSAFERVGGEFQVNATTSGDQQLSSVALQPGGHFVAAWQGPLPQLPTTQVWAVRGPLLKGDVDANGVVNVADVLYFINFLFAGGPVPPGLADCDGNAFINVSDVLYLINYLFAGGPLPV